jgi:hypothetical protein
MYIHRIRFEVYVRGTSEMILEINKKKFQIRTYYCMRALCEVISVKYVTRMIYIRFIKMHEVIQFMKKKNKL